MFESVIRETMVRNTIHKYFYFNVCINYESYISVKLTFLKELILIRQAHQKNVIFITIGNFLIKCLSFNRVPVIGVMIY